MTAEHSSEEGGEGLTPPLSAAEWSVLRRGSGPAVERILADRLAAANTHAIECERIGVKAIEDRIMAEAERDDLRGRLAAVEALADEWGERARRRGDTGPDTAAHAASELRAALANPSAAQGEEEVAARVLREAADAFEDEQRRKTRERQELHVWSVACAWLRARADSLATPAPEADQ